MQVSHGHEDPDGTRYVALKKITTYDEALHFFTKSADEWTATDYGVAMNLTHKKIFGATLKTMRNSTSTHPGRDYVAAMVLRENGTENLTPTGLRFETVCARGLR